MHTVWYIVCRVFGDATEKKVLHFLTTNPWIALNADRVIVEREAVAAADPSYLFGALPTEPVRLFIEARMTALQLILGSKRQGNAQWFILRKAYITATLAAHVTAKTATETVLQYRDRTWAVINDAQFKVNVATTRATKVGHDSEEHVLKELAAMPLPELRAAYRTGIIISSAYPGLAASPDAVAQFGDGIVCIEIKTKTTSKTAQEYTNRALPFTKGVRVVNVQYDDAEFRTLIGREWACQVLHQVR